MMRNSLILFVIVISDTKEFTHLKECELDTRTKIKKKKNPTVGIFFQIFKFIR